MTELAGLYEEHARIIARAVTREEYAAACAQAAATACRASQLAVEVRRACKRACKRRAPERFAIASARRRLSAARRDHRAALARVLEGAPHLRLDQLERLSEAIARLEGAAQQ